MIYFYSTNNKHLRHTFREAVINGIAPDGGLYMPVEFPDLSDSLFSRLGNLSYHDIALNIILEYVSDISQEELEQIIREAYNFDVPLHNLENNLSVLELFHGPTLAFKDFGARFLARILARYVKNESKKIVILVATSGDTGSAVASGFYNIEGIEVALLYPGNKVSKIQERQLTTMGGNIHAFEVAGVFDDCQTLVKQAFLDQELKNKFYLSSANSINIARLLPQSMYYVYALQQVTDHKKSIIFCVPSGNFGNLTAGIFALRMGMPVKRFIAAVNANDVFPSFLNSGSFNVKPAVMTLSNAMDVGNPSNFFRITDLFNGDLAGIREHIYSTSISDSETIDTIREIYRRYDYIMDPHGAVGYQAAKRYRSRFDSDDHIIILETAHPAKFADTVKEALDLDIEIPARLARTLNKKKKAQKISAKYDEFKSSLIENFD